MQEVCDIYISAGEASGDLLGAELARRLLEKDPALVISGMGGNKMQAAGVDVHFNAHALSVVGILEILSKLPRILWTWCRIKQYLKRAKPRLIIFIDFPDTHFRLLKTAKKIGCIVHYYVSPQIWAWRANRIRSLKKYVDHMAVLFAFEEKLYQTANIPVTFVGHPLATLATPSLPKADAYAFFQLDPNRPIISLFPGSRHSEVKRHLPILLKTAQTLASKKPELQFVLALAPHFSSNDFTLPANITVTQAKHYDLMQISHVAIAASGTVTLEIGLLQTPLCVFYKLNALSYWIAKHLIHIRQFSLCNIVLEKTVAKEYIQAAATESALAIEVLHLLDDTPYRDAQRSALSALHAKISNPAGMAAWIAMICEKGKSR